LNSADRRPIFGRMNYQASIPAAGPDERAGAAGAMNDSLTPKAVVAALDAHIVGQTEAKRAVAVALRNRWRRQRLGDDLRDEVTPKNILMIGPTGCGKTEISRRLAKLADAPFVKVEATKFTEVGYVGRDVEQIARDLVEEAVRLEKERRRLAVKSAAEEAAMDRLLEALTGKGASEATRESFRQRFRDGHLAKAEVEIDVSETPAAPFEIPGMGGQVGMINLSDMMAKAMGQQPKKRRRLKVGEAWKRLVEEEADKRLDQDDVARVALLDAEANGIVFLDEIDKIAVSDVRGGSVSREGVQRDLLPLIEGTTVATKYGPMKTDHILFIASGAFHVAKPSDLLPELQGRLPIRVELKALTEADFVRILSDTQASLTEQYRALIATEGVEVNFTADGIRAVARIAAEVNGQLENIGARRLQTVMEKLLEDVSFEAEERRGETVTVDAAYVEKQLADIARDTDLSKYVL
jgi:ATP-dependent HslUV protease ATP-binding subunit HslU